MHLQQIKVAVQTVTWKTCSDYKQANKVLTHPKNWNSAGAESRHSESSSFSKKQHLITFCADERFISSKYCVFFSHFHVYIPQMCCILLINFAVWKHSEILMCIKYHFTSTSSSLRYCASSAAKRKRSVQSNTRREFCAKKTFLNSRFRRFLFDLIKSDCWGIIYLLEVFYSKDCQIHHHLKWKQRHLFNEFIASKTWVLTWVCERFKTLTLKGSNSSYEDVWSGLVTENCSAHALTAVYNCGNQGNIREAWCRHGWFPPYIWTCA